MRKSLPFFAVILTSLFLQSLFLVTPAQAAQYCLGGGKPQAGQGGSQGDRCFPDQVISGIGDTVCCRIPDGNSQGSLFCDTGKGNSTYGTCQPATLKEGNNGCKEDKDCDQTKDLRCDVPTKKCVPNNCSKTAGTECKDAYGCCASANLQCSFPLNDKSQKGTCQSTKCSEENGPCGTAGGTCCTGKNLACVNNKCVGPSSTGGACKGENLDCTSNEQCCPNLGLICDLNRQVNQTGTPKCVKKTDIATPVPSMPPPPSPPCTQGKWVNGQCTSFLTALGELKTDPTGFTQRVFAILLSFSGGIALLLIMRAGYVLMTSQGKPQQIQEGRDQLIAAIVGLLFLIFSFVLLEVIGYDILRVPGFGK